MARFASAFRSTGAGSTTLPIASLYAPAGADPLVYEVGVFNTTTTQVAIALIRLTSTGTVGAAQAETAVDDPGATATATAVNTHTVAPGITAGAFLRMGSLGAAIGSGVIWTFGERGLRIPKGTANGLGIIVATGTGQVCDCYFEWSE